MYCGLSKQQGQLQMHVAAVHTVRVSVVNSTISLHIHCISATSSLTFIIEAGMDGSSKFIFHLLTCTIFHISLLHLPSTAAQMPLRSVRSSSYSIYCRSVVCSSTWPAPKLSSCQSPTTIAAPYNFSTCTS